MGRIVTLESFAMPWRGIMALHVFMYVAVLSHGFFSRSTARVWLGGAVQEADEWALDNDNTLAISSTYMHREE